MKLFRATAVTERGGLFDIKRQELPGMHMISLRALSFESSLNYCRS